MNIGILIKIIRWSLIAAAAVIGFAKLISNEKRSVREWLLFAVSEAEKLLGGKTGALKLRKVFGAFVETFPVFSTFVSFDTFSGWVDGALEDMRALLENEDKTAVSLNSEAENDRKEENSHTVPGSPVRHSEAENDRKEENSHTVPRSPVRQEENETRQEDSE